jgi:hypothetical protein
MSNIIIEFEDRFIPEPISGCFLWIGSYYRNGYGRFQHLSSGVKRTRAHRVSWMIYRGHLWDNHLVLHKCDNPSCVNPDHLFVGSHRDNIADKIAKGRQMRGTMHGHARLTEDLVREIKSDPATSRVVARRLGVSQSCVARIRSGRGWRHVN